MLHLTACLSPSAFTGGTATRELERPVVSRCRTEAAPGRAVGVRPTTGVTLFIAYIQIYDMVKTIRVSEEYHEWLAAHKQDGETMEETLRRMTGGPHPEDVAGLLSDAEADEAKAAVEALRGRDGDRFEDARAAFDDE
jgi:hypothetical protein